MAIKRLNRSQRDLLTQAANRYHDEGADQAEKYLAGRGIEWWPGLDGFRLGVAVNPVPGHERFGGWLSIPYLTPSGVVAMRFRCIQDHDCKAVECQRYDGPPGLSTRLYNVQALHDAGETLCVAEGEIDAMHATRAGVACVGISGGGMWKPHWTQVFEDFAEVIPLCDGDETGNKMAKRFTDELENVRPVHYDKGFDTNRFINAYGVSAFHERIFGPNYNLSTELNAVH